MKDLMAAATAIWIIGSIISTALLISHNESHENQHSPGNGVLWPLWVFVIFPIHAIKNDVIPLLFGGRDEHQVVTDRGEPVRIYYPKPSLIVLGIGLLWKLAVTAAVVEIWRRTH